MPYTLLRFESFLVFMAAMVIYFSQGGTYLGLLLILLPDLSIIGYFKNPRVGALVYNIAHTYVSPFILLIFSFKYLQLWGILFSFLWVAHIGIDRALGIGLKLPTGFSDTHLGKLHGKFANKITKRGT